MPVTGDILEIENWRLEVVDMDGMRIDKVLASRIKTSGLFDKVIDENIEIDHFINTLDHKNINKIQQFI